MSYNDNRLETECIINNFGCIMNNSKFIIWSYYKFYMIYYLYYLYII